jgi:hypothetical protein
VRARQVVCFGFTSVELARWFGMGDQPTIRRRLGVWALCRRRERTRFPRTPQSLLVDELVADAHWDTGLADDLCRNRELGWWWRTLHQVERTTGRRARWRRLGCLRHDSTKLLVNECERE